MHRFCREERVEDKTWRADWDYLPNGCTSDRCFETMCCERELIDSTLQITGNPKIRLYGAVIMDLTEFAATYNLKAKRDAGDDTTIIPGRTGHIYEHSEAELAVMYILPNEIEPRPRAWSAARKRGIAAGMILRQNGDAEGALSFDPTNAEQVKLAIRVAGIKRKRRLSESDRAKRAARASRLSQIRSDGLTA